ncbi:MAG TPA: hypothetical protein VM450_04075 [Thermomicrobiales bacterium]|nr:hypothetical protein [Thermomicrobiales bacterium]
MAKNVGGRRIGAIRGRAQYRLPNGHYAKIDRKTGEILSIKADRTPYRNVVMLRSAPAVESPTPTAPERPTLSPLDRPAWRARTSRRLAA